MSELLANVNSRETAKEYLQGALDQLLENVSSNAVPAMIFVSDDTITPAGERFGDLKRKTREKGKRLYATVDGGTFHYYEFPIESGLHLPPTVRSFLSAEDLEDFELQSHIISMQNSAARKAARRAAQ